MGEPARVPRRLHQIWIQGQDRLPRRLVELQRTWQQLNPHYEYRLWDEAALRDLIGVRHGWFLPTFDRYPHLHQRADAGRLFVLYEYGGFYVDADARALRPLDELIAMVPYARLIVSDLPFTGMMRAVVAVTYRTRRLVTNAFIGMEAGLPEWRDVLQRLPHTADILSFHKELSIAFSTGPWFLARAIDRAFAHSRDQVVVMPSRLFERRAAYQPLSAPPPDAFMDHLLDGSWHAPWLQRLLGRYSRWAQSRHAAGRGT